MKEFLDKISSYNLFNYLLPGVLFIVILGKFTTHSFTISDLIIGAFVSYFIGLVVSRFGSLVIEPLLKKVSFLRFATYSDFVSASTKDPKLEILSEVNNMYRTFSAMFVLIVLIRFGQFIEIKFPLLKIYNLYILIGLLLVMFLYSYRKQTQYITKRVEANLKK